MSGFLKRLFSSKYICASCGEKYTESGEVSSQSRAYGGVSCRNCGNFYFEPCVSKVLLSHLNRQRSMACERGKSRTWIECGSLLFENFNELAVTHT